MLEVIQMYVYFMNQPLSSEFIFGNFLLNDNFPWSPPPETLNCIHICEGANFKKKTLVSFFDVE